MKLLRMTIIAGALATGMTGPVARAADLPPSVQAGGYALQQVGKGRLTWLGFGIYEASLWTTDGQFETFRHGEPVALSLWYERKFTRAELIDITTGEWARLELAPPASRAAWASSLEQIWSDVARGDNVTTVVIPGRETRFYNRDRLMGRVADPAFGPAFLRIWLDSRSAVSDLRAALLGGDGSR